jgi:hypothetical protein
MVKGDARIAIHCSPAHKSQGLYSVVWREEMLGGSAEKTGAEGTHQKLFRGFLQSLQANSYKSFPVFLSPISLSFYASRGYWQRDKIIYERSFINFFVYLIFPCISLFSLHLLLSLFSHVPSLPLTFSSFLIYIFLYFSSFCSRTSVLLSFNILSFRSSSFISSSFTFRFRYSKCT